MRRHSLLVLGKKMRKSCIVLECKMEEILGIQENYKMRGFMCSTVRVILLGI